MPQFSRASLLGLAIGVTLSTGCVQLPKAPPESHEMAPPAEKTTLAKSQVADVQVALGRMMEERGQVDQAVQAYTQALQKDPGRADACARLAVLHDQQGKFHESESFYKRSLAIQPNDPDVYSDRGYSRYLQQQWPDAEKDLREALRLKPDHRRAHNNLGLVLARLGHHEEALASFVLAGCTKADARANLGYALCLNRKWAEATEQYELALSHDSSHAGARKGLQNLKVVLARVESTSQASHSQQGGTATPTRSP